MKGMIKNTVAGFVTRYTPSVLSYLAGRHARNELALKVSGVCIDVIDKRGKRIIRLNRRSAHYIVDMMNAFEYYFGSVNPVPWVGYRGAYSLVDFSSPRYHEIRGFDDFPILSPSLTEPLVTAMQYLEYGRLAEGDTVLDLGCYSGLTSIVFSKAIGSSGRVISVEPDYGNYECSRKNIGLHSRVNGLDNIALHNIAVSSRCGIMRFSSEAAMGSADVSIVGDYRGSITEVQCLDLAALVQHCSIDKVDFIKMDIEGSELEVIKHSEEFFLRYRPRIIFEPHLVGGSLSSEGVVQSLEGFGYACDYIEQTGVSLPLVFAEPMVN